MRHSAKLDTWQPMEKTRQASKLLQLLLQLLHELQPDPESNKLSGKRQGARGGARRGWGLLQKLAGSQLKALLNLLCNMSVAWNAFKQGQAIIKSSEKCVSLSWSWNWSWSWSEYGLGWAELDCRKALSSIKLNFALTEAHCKLTNTSRVAEKVARTGLKDP